MADKTIEELDPLLDITSSQTLVVTSEEQTNTAYKETLEELSLSLKILSFNDDGAHSSLGAIESVVGKPQQVAVYNQEDGISLHIGSTFYQSSSEKFMIKSRISTYPYLFGLFVDASILSGNFTYDIPFIATTKNYETEDSEVLHDSLSTFFSSSTVTFERVGPITLRGENLLCGYQDAAKNFVRHGGVQIHGTLITNSITFKQEDPDVIYYSNLVVEDASVLIGALSSSNGSISFLSSNPLPDGVIFDCEELHVIEGIAADSNELMVSNEAVGGKIAFNNDTVINSDLNSEQILLYNNLFYTNSASMTYRNIVARDYVAGNIISSKNPGSGDIYGVKFVTYNGESGSALSALTSSRYLSYKGSGFYLGRKTPGTAFWAEYTQAETWFNGFDIVAGLFFEVQSPRLTFKVLGLILPEPGQYMIIMNVKVSSSTTIKKGYVEWCFKIFSDPSVKPIYEGNLNDYAIIKDGAQYFSVRSSEVYLNSAPQGEVRYLVPVLWNNTGTGTIEVDLTYFYIAKIA